ncbi:hypothetical protein [Catenuloplanes indicus]|uniref:Uncharacterized protein n=1 Tax=Catenuloplanes indicus TaxID=137267 RepID=A0AAE3VWQ2_9ACTN|nr:hypothetical protein [Catenuloplanes indicus]MDQ0365126.1 hypothetical protein [Catenuloplanes indicus]
MPNERDGPHDGGSIVDIPQANSLTEQIEKDDKVRQQEKHDDQKHPTNH